MGKPVLVLVGGGHTHALLLKNIQKSGFPPCRILLISATRFTPYSGMLPGVISGRYSPEQSFIDLGTLAEQSGCEFIEESVLRLNADQKQLVTESGTYITYDFLSINIGSTQARIIDAQNCISIKPVAPFLNWLNTDLPKALAEKQSFDLMIVGAGAAGIEVALALTERFKSSQCLQIHLITASGVAFGYPQPVRDLIEEELAEKKINVHRQFRVASVTGSELVSDAGQSLQYDQLILATPAAPALWPAESSLASSQSGFIRVNSALQSVSHVNVFACGDIAEFTDNSIAKSGVYAVRQAPVLYKNLVNVLSGHALEHYQPQEQFLSLLSCADGRAIASRGWFRARGSMVWLWKDWIDRRFMAQFPRPQRAQPGFSIREIR